MNKVFKRSIFGGFRRKDVVAYLETLGQKHQQSENRAAEEIGALKRQLDDTLKREQEARHALEQARADLEAERETARARLDTAERGLEEAERARDALLADVAKLEGDKSALFQENMQLEEEKNQLAARLLDSDDERTALLTEHARFEQEADAQRRELEKRIFDLEAEVLEGLEQEWPSHELAGNEQILQHARQLAACLERPDVSENGPLLREVEARLEVVLAKLGVLCAQAEPALGDADEPALTDADEPALGDAGEPALADAGGIEPRLEQEARPPARKKGTGKVVVRRPAGLRAEKTENAEAGEKSEKCEKRLGTVRDILRYVRNR